MPSLLSADEIIEIAGGRLAQGMVPEEPGPICTDTRKSVEGSWFLALKGERFDGHDFLGDAFSGGALGCIVEERHSYPIPSTSFPLIAVPDTFYALKDLGRNWRRRLAVKVIFVVNAESGRSLALSRYICKMLSARFLACTIDASAGSRLALADLVRLDEETEFVVVNMVPPGVEDIEPLSQAFCPNVILFIDEPFSYLRLCSDAEELASMAHKTIACMDRRAGSVLICGQADRWITAEHVPPPHSARIHASAAGNVIFQSASSASGDCFMPSAEESWCISELAKSFGFPDDIIYGAFV